MDQTPRYWFPTETARHATCNHGSRRPENTATNMLASTTLIAAAGAQLARVLAP